MVHLYSNKTISTTIYLPRETHSVKTSVDILPCERLYYSWKVEQGSLKDIHITLRCARLLPQRFFIISLPSSAGGTNALTVYQIGDDVVAPTPAPTPEVEEPTPAPTTDVEEGEYGELGCAVDLTDDVRVRDGHRQ